MTQYETTGPSSREGLPGAQVVQALELVNYQDGAIADREVIRTITGTVWRFSPSTKASG